MQPASLPELTLAVTCIFRRCAAVIEPSRCLLGVAGLTPVTPPENHGAGPAHDGYGARDRVLCVDGWDVYWTVHTAEYGDTPSAQGFVQPASLSTPLLAATGIHVVPEVFAEVVLPLRCLHEVAGSLRLLPSLNCAELEVLNDKPPGNERKLAYSNRRHPYVCNFLIKC